MNLRAVICAFMDIEFFRGSIIQTCQDVNNSYDLCNKFLGFSPFSAEFQVINTCVDIVQGTALTLASLFFIIEFFSKTIQLEWVKWENIIMLFAKLFVAKALIDNSPAIMNIIYVGFGELQTNLQTALSGLGSGGFLPVDNDGVIKLFVGQEGWDAIVADQSNWAGTVALMKWLSLQPTFLILNLVMILCQIIVLGRVFELMVYTIMAPLPMATFTSSATNDVGKTFVKSYCAICLQAFVLIVMFAAFKQLLPLIQTEVAGITGYGSMSALLMTGTLGMGVMKSGGWAKKLCGTA